MNNIEKAIVYMNQKTGFPFIPEFSWFKVEDPDHFASLYAEDNNHETFLDLSTDEK